MRFNLAFKGLIWSWYSKNSDISAVVKNSP